MSSTDALDPIYFYSSYHNCSLHLAMSLCQRRALYFCILPLPFTGSESLAPSEDGPAPPTAAVKQSKQMLLRMASGRQKAGVHAMADSKAQGPQQRAPLIEQVMLCKDSPVFVLSVSMRLLPSSVTCHQLVLSLSSACP